MADPEEKQPESTEAEEVQETAPEATEQEEIQETASPANVPEAIAGVGILVVGFTQERAADQTLENMKQAKKQGTFYYEDAAVVRQDAKGGVHINETKDMSTGKGAGVGAVVGGLLGLLGGPAGVVVGAGLGAGLGGALAHHDAGFSKDRLDDVGTALRPGTSALVVTTSKYFVEQLRKEVPPAELADVTRRIVQNISDSIAAGKDMVLGMLFTEKGVAVEEIRVDDETAEIFGMVITDEGYAAAAAVVTEEGGAYESVVVTDEGTEYEEGIFVPEDEAIAGELADTESDVDGEDEEQDQQA